ncbi:MAG TPA: hypothetical protein VHX13_10260 [Acidobacteriaceae bacterium]|nr:hypothetical protein [Acidobacteriaceae bacterium]
MELLSNLVWIAVAIALWGGWLAQRGRGRGASLPSGLRAQVAALAVLTLILLPVISVSDDLQASHNPAEVERTCIRSDQHLLRPDAIPPAPAALAAVIGSLLPCPPGAIAFLRTLPVPRSDRTESVPILASRPPPAV